LIAGLKTLHAQQSLDALSAGNHVASEKPMAMNREDAKAMIADEKNKKFLMIGLNQRLMPPHVKAKQIAVEVNQRSLRLGSFSEGFAQAIKAR
jgi:predicted dehydrogenase